MKEKRKNNWLDAILNEGEGYLIEFKESLSRIDKEIVAFANASGGSIFLGITDDSKIKGFTLDNKVKSEIISISINCDPAINVTIEKYDNIAIVIVPEGKNKPYKCASGFYLRNGATSQKMTTDEIIAIVQSEGRVRFDEQKYSKATFQEIFNKSKYVSFARKCGISLDYLPEDILMNLGLLDSEVGKHYFNNAGALLFANNPALLFPQSIVTGVLYKGIEKLHILDRKDFDSDLISNIEEAMIFLKKHLNLSYEIKSLRREDIWEIPEEALREAVVNAVVHRDYFEKGANILIEIYDDRVVISNPGGLMKGLDSTEFGSKSISRNPLLSSVMLRANYIEKLGTGINRIQNALKEAGKPEAKFIFNNFFTIIFERNVTEVDSVKGSPISTPIDSVNGSLKTIDSSPISEVTGNIDEKGSLKGSPISTPIDSVKSSPKSSTMILDLIQNNPRIKINELIDILGLSSRAIKKHFSNLKEQNKIKRVGSNRSGYWEVIEY